MGCLFRIIKSFIVAVTIIFVLVLWKGFSIYKSAIEETPLQTKISEMVSNENYVTINNISDYMKEFIVTIEDKRFYNHNGIDIVAIMGSAINNFFAGYYKYGGSTITQQLAKNMYFSQDKNIPRKVAEMFLAFRLEKQYSKDKILELYLNQIYFGYGYNGINQASYGYFSTSPKDLTEYQASLLVGLPQAPSLYDLKNKNDSMKKRYYDVLRNLVQNKNITKEQEKQFKEMYMTS